MATPDGLHEASIAGEGLKLSLLAKAKDVEEQVCMSLMRLRLLSTLQRTNSMQMYGILGILYDTSPSILHVLRPPMGPRTCGLILQVVFK